MRLSTFLLAMVLIALAMVSFVVAQNEPAATDAAETVPTTTDTEVPAPEAEAEKPNNPWIKEKLSGLALGENSALAIPVPILLAIGVVFLASVGYGIFLIFDSDKQRLRKAEELKAKRAAKDAKKGSKKK